MKYSYNSIVKNIKREKAYVSPPDNGWIIVYDRISKDFNPDKIYLLDFQLLHSSKDEFNPETPLIDWLEKRTQNIRARKGFPAVCW